MRRLLLFVVTLVLASGTVAAEEPPRLQPTAVEGITVDGRLDEAGWKDALALPISNVDVPSALGEALIRTLQPTLHAVVDDGQLCLAASCAEPPGTGCGLVVFVAPADADSAGLAWSLAYWPLNPRVDRYIVRTSNGVGRAHCPLVGAIDASQVNRWTLELRIPLAKVGAKPTDALRLAAVVATRTPTLVAPAPVEAKWRGPQEWFVLDAPDGGWSDEGVPDAETLAAEARVEAECRQAWDTFLQQTHEPVALIPSAVDTILLDAARGVVKMRRDLLPVIQTIVGDLFERSGAFESAAKSYDAALSVAPGWCEARFGRDVRLRARRILATPAASGAPTDYAAAFAQVAAGRQSGDAWDRHGWDLTEGLLHVRACDFTSAIPILQRVADRFAGEEWPQLRLERAKEEQEPFALERMQRKREAVAALPRVKLQTNRGDVVVELFEKDAPNAVDQFVWLVEQGFYDGTRVHHAVPFSLAAMGDPFSKDDDSLPKAGTGGPGYEIQVKESKRRAYRGSIAFPLPKRRVHTAGSRFVLLTGLAVSAEGLATFGTIVAGQDVADALRAGDRIESATVVRKASDRAYRPVGLDGKPAPEPK